jgi:hypothetical protein
LVVTIGNSWGAEPALNPVGVQNVRQIVILDGINHETALGGLSLLNSSCLILLAGELTGQPLCLTVADCSNTMPPLGLGGGDCPSGLDQGDCVAAVPEAAGGAFIRNLQASAATNACGGPDANQLFSDCLGSLSRGFKIAGVQEFVVPNSDHCSIGHSDAAKKARLAAVDDALREAPRCPEESSPCPPR